jgi:enamine deaminase RidA (YjgF/YER057c/UK114 family)
MVSNADQESTMVLKIERFQPEGMNIRMSGGKPSYSHVLTVSGSGKIVYTAGQLARDIDGNCVGKGDMRAQMEQTFQNLDRCLKAAGRSFLYPVQFSVKARSGVGAGLLKISQATTRCRVRVSLNDRTTVTAILA